MKYSVDSEIIINDIVLLAADGEVDSCKPGPDILVIAATRDRQFECRCHGLLGYLLFAIKKHRVRESSKYDYVL